MRHAAASALAAAFLSSGCHGQAATADACEHVTFDGRAFTDCIVAPAQDRIALVLDGKNGKPLRSLRRLADDEPGNDILFAMNGGMFDTDGQPIGLAVIDGHERHAINMRRGDGNFYWQPNGVFSLEGDGAHIRTTDAYRATPTTSVRFATQSGPMLVIEGTIHPDMADDGKSRNVRNGVGMDRARRLHFVISDEAVSFGVLARFFRDGLRCDNALYLDGYVSSLWDPASGRLDDKAALGPLIVVRKS